MCMVYHEEPMRLVPAHLPCISDVEKISKVIGRILKWWTTNSRSANLTPSGSMGISMSNRPRTHTSSRAKSPINYKELTHGASGERNKQRQMDSVDNAMQPNQLGASLGIFEGGQKHNVRGEDQNEQPCYLQHFGQPDDHTGHQQSSRDVGGNSRSHSINSGLSILRWNERGVARKGFRCNIRKSITDHDPMIVIITETKVARPHIWRRLWIACPSTLSKRLSLWVTLAGL